MDRKIKKNFDTDIYCITADVYCHTFKDDSGALELAKIPKFRPCTKHINKCYHHTREYVRQGKINNHAIDINNQIADMLTKLLQQHFFIKHCKMLIGM